MSKKLPTASLDTGTNSFLGIPCRRGDRRRGDRLRNCKRRDGYRAHYWTELRRSNGRPVATIERDLVAPLQDHLEKLKNT